MTEQSTAVDIFQFYSGSADAAPGKGAGETLVSPASTYAALRKITGWRRSLAAGEKLDEILPLTGSAQLWEAPLKKPKVRREDYEARRQEVRIPNVDPPKEDKEQPPQQMEEQPLEQAPALAPAPSVAPKKSKAQELIALREAKAKAAAAAAAEEAAVAAAPPEAAPEASKKTKKTKTSAPESALAQPDAPQIPIEVSRPDMEKEDQTSTIRFCPICRYYLYLQVSSTKDSPDPKTMAHYRLCRNCGYKEQDEKGGLLSEIVIKEKSAEGYKILLNEHTRHDPRLPHLRGVLKCPNGGCDSNVGGKESDIIYMKYDSVNLLYLYICDICGQEWHSRR